MKTTERKIICAGIYCLNCYFSWMNEKVDLSKEIFNSIKSLLQKELGSQLTIESDNKFIIDDSGLFMQYNNEELILGFGFMIINHHPEYSDMKVPIERFFSLLSNRKRITQSYRKNKIYKEKTEVLNEQGEIIEEFEVKTNWGKLYKPKWSRVLESPKIIQRDLTEELKKTLSLLKK